MKRIFLFVATNIAVMLMVSITMSLIGVRGSQFSRLFIMAMVMGFSGAFISLFLSKVIAKWTTGARVITHATNETEAWLLQTVERQALKAGIAMPEVAMYEGEPNAFATGPSRNNSLVAVSTGLLQSMTADEVEAVLAHEVSHVANGDMVTLTLIQGTVNTFVTFFARIVGQIVDSATKRDDNQGPGIAYIATVFLCDILFGILGSIIVMYFSRQREYRADRGAALILGSPLPMISALQRLERVNTTDLPKTMAASGITGSGGLMSLLATHPSTEQRIAALQNF